MANINSSGKKNPPKDVNAYLKLVPSETVAALQSLRKTIRAAAPDAEEIIS